MKTLFLLLALGFIADTAFGLVGGQKPKPNQFPALALLEDCTATKIGSHHFLLAAHCVVNAAETGDGESYVNQVKSEFTEGAEIGLDRETLHRKNHWTHRLKVARTFVHPAYRYTSLSDPWQKPQGISDIAVVVVDKATPEIPQLPLYRKPLAPGDTILKAGYGCPETAHDKILDWVSAGERELLYFETRVEDGAKAIASYHAGAKKSAKQLQYYASDEQRNYIASSFTVTRGKFHAGAPKKATDKGDAKEASLGYSDSGGPLLIAKGGKLSVAGVNAKSLLWPKEEHGTSLEPVAYDLHTRTDDTSFTGTSAWLDKVLAVEPGSAKKSLAIDGVLTATLDLTKIPKRGDLSFPNERDEPLLTKKYLRAERKKLELRLLTPSGRPCPIGIERVTIYDLNLEEDLVWALTPDKDEDEKKLKAVSPGTWEISHSANMVIESVRLGLKPSGAKSEEQVCLLQVQ